MILVLFSSDIMKGGRQPNWIYDHIVWDSHVQQQCKGGILKNILHVRISFLQNSWDTLSKAT